MKSAACEGPNGMRFRPGPARARHEQSTIDRTAFGGPLDDRTCYRANQAEALGQSRSAALEPGVDERRPDRGIVVRASGLCWAGDGVAAKNALPLRAAIDSSSPG